MEKETGRAVQRLGRLPWPAQFIVGALTVVGAVTVVKWIVSILAWLVTLLAILVVLIGLVFLVLTGRLRRKEG
jgi:predicted ferric reductase